MATVAFIKAVKSRPDLWDTSQMSYKRSTGEKDVLWEEIEKQFGFPNLKAVKGHWKKLRDCHREALKRQYDARVTGKRMRPWKHQKLMEFIIPHMTNRGNDDYLNVMHDLADQDDVYSTHSDTDNADTPEPAPSDGRPKEVFKKFKREDLQDDTLEFLNMDDITNDKVEKIYLEETQVPEQKRDALDYFFRSMASTTKRLPIHLQLQIKRKIFEAVTEAEEAASGQSFSQQPFLMNCQGKLS